jgi:hypothetical protein
MISKHQRQKIAKYFPEISVDDFIRRFAVPEANANIATLTDCQAIAARIVDIAQDLNAEQAFEEQEYISKQEAVDSIIDQIIYSCAVKKLFVYKDGEDELSNMVDNSIALTNDLSRKSFANVVVRAMIRNKDLADPIIHQQRAAILKALWFGLIEVGRKVENWSMAESSKMKRM